MAFEILIPSDTIAMNSNERQNAAPRRPPPAPAAGERCVICLIDLPSFPIVQLGEANLFECSACGSWIFSPRPTTKEQSALHDTQAYFEHPYFEARRRNASATDERCRRIFERIAHGINVESLRGNCMLDVGCDTGEFLASAAGQFGIVPVGIDVSSRAIEQSKARGIQAHLSSLEAASSTLTGLPLITAIDLVEHLPDPSAFAREAMTRLMHGGIFYLETPNKDSIVYKIGRLLSKITRGRPRALLARLFPSQHLQYFSKQGLVRWAQNLGYEPVDIGTRHLPMRDTATSLVVRMALALLQLFDRITGRMILITAVLRKA
jgi:2-polyprenyl-3-methyl-5-hydroxy-6-metoxy-1,4-benzoquinol methylase